MNLDLLHIPDFLKRVKKKGRPRSITAKPLYTQPDEVGIHLEWDKIKRKRYGERYDIHLNNQAPRIGSGLRIVYVKEGRKWVFMTSHAGDPAKRDGKVVKRFTLKQWKVLKASHERYIKRNDPDEVAKRISSRRYRRI